MYIKSKSALLIVHAAFALVSVALISVLTPGSAFAVSADEQKERITLSPSSSELKLDAGSVMQGTMKIINDGDVAYGFSVYARPYGVTNELYNPTFTNHQLNSGVYKWVQFDQTKYSINPGDSVDVNYTIRVPADAAPGGHYGVLFAETDERGLEGTGVARKKRVGNLLYVTVNGEYKTSGVFKEFILPFWQKSSPVISSARVENTGNADFRAKVSTTAKDFFGRTKYTYTGDPIILPDTVRLAEMKWEAAPNFGFFKVDQSVEFLDQKHQNSGYVLIAPKWAPIVLIVMLGAGAAYAVLQRRNSRR
jgi:hypothetical protein